MAVRYFCDRCNIEVGEGELRVAELSLPPEPDITLELCSDCADEVRKHLLGHAPAPTAEAQHPAPLHPPEAGSGAAWSSTSM